ncbi:MAG: 8-amino-7-oxononanoate synthase [Desulfobulbaceae bacterium]|nr:8-amino-7-oxononanoate synthase [Desulfobulbaceae bacterium]
MNILDPYLEPQLRDLDRQGLLRRLVPLSRADGAAIVEGGRPFLNLSGNDYLGLAADRELAAQFYRRLDNDTILDLFGPGASASRLMAGNSGLYDRLESRLAELYGTGAALVFNSGYHCNSGILPALAGKEDLILADKLCHASLIDGMRLARAKMMRYRHLDYDQLADILRSTRHRHDRVFIVTESIFSMDGDVADLRRLTALKNRFQCVLYLDEAHAVGVLGPRGLGLAEQEGVTGDIELLIGTFGKALGGLGGFAVCSAVTAQYLINRARPLIYSTALPPVCLNWLLFVLERIPGLVEERRRLQRLAADLRRNLVNLGLTVGGASHIIPVIVGDSKRALRAADRLRQQGWWVTAVRPPTVPAHTARLRLSLSAAMDPGDLSLLPAQVAAAVQ